MGMQVGGACCLPDPSMGHGQLAGWCATLKPKPYTRPTGSCHPAPPLQLDVTQPGFVHATTLSAPGVEGTDIWVSSQSSYGSGTANGLTQGQGAVAPTASGGLLGWQLALIVIGSILGGLGILAGVVVLYVRWATHHGSGRVEGGQGQEQG